MTPMAESMQVYFAAKNLLPKGAVTAMAHLPSSWKELRNMCKRMDLVESVSVPPKSRPPLLPKTSSSKKPFEKRRISMIDLETAQSLFADHDIGSDVEEIVGENEVFFIRNQGKKSEDSKASKSSPSSTSKDSKWTLRCTHCKGTGHRASDCKAAWAPDRCFVCGAEGVKVSNCPKCSGNGKADVKPEGSRTPTSTQ